MKKLFIQTAEQLGPFLAAIFLVSMVLLPLAGVTLLFAIAWRIVQ